MSGSSAPRDPPMRVRCRGPLRRRLREVLRDESGMGTVEAAYAIAAISVVLMFCIAGLAAMTTAQRLALYEDIVDARDIYCIIALTAYYNRCFGTCSRAFSSALIRSTSLIFMRASPPLRRRAYGARLPAALAQIKPGTIPAPRSARAAARPWPYSSRASP